FTDYDYARSMAVDALGNIVLTGSFEDRANFNPGTGQQFVLSSFGVDDIYLLKLDTNGSFQWVRQYGSNTTDGATALTRDPSGNIYLTGYFTGTVNFNPGGSANVNSAETGSNFVLKLDKSGTFDWVAGMGGFSDAIALDGSGDVFSTG